MTRCSTPDPESTVYSYRPWWLPVIFDRDEWFHIHIRRICVPVWQLAVMSGLLTVNVLVLLAAATFAAPPPPTIVDTSYRDDYGGGKDCHKVNKHARRCPDYLTLLTYLLTYLLTATAFLLKQLCFERIFIEIVGRTRFCIMNGVWLRILLL